MDVPSGPASFVLAAANEQRGIIVTFASFGTMILIRTFITVMIVAYAGKAEV